MIVRIQTAQPIRMDDKSGTFGFALLADQGNNILVALTHLPIDDSSHEDPTSGFHVKVLDLMKPTPDCAGANFKVKLENSKNNTAFDADYAWQVNGNKIVVTRIPVSGRGDAGV